MSLASLLALMLEHADLIGDVLELIQSGASKDAIKKTLADLKVQVSDTAFREELGLSPLAKPAGA